MATTTSDAPGFRLIYEGAMGYGIYAFIFFGLTATVVTLWYLFREDTSRRHKQLLLVAWGVLPPTWFVVEYFFLFLPSGVKDSFGFFQYGQNVASKLWAAVFALISVSLYTDKSDKKPEPPADPKTETRH